MKKAKRAAVLVLAGLVGCAHSPDPRPADRVGRIYSYVRSNADGSEAEAIHIYRASRTHIQVTKMRERCTNAAFVTADLDLEAGQAIRLTGGRLRPGAGHEDFAVMTYDRFARRIDARIDLPEGPLNLSTQIADEPWHLYDFDLASLTITAQYRLDRRSGFSFGVPLFWTEGEPRDALRYLGRADARFAGEEVVDGRRALRFEVGGTAFAGRGGPMWFDAAEGHILAARWGVPNHAGYRDFSLRLTGVSDGGEAHWRALLSRHFENCPAR